eukprot:TRINITY_DN95868_c0_g1_i1.p1 TRINITY_DN95868_c0_g1~~TRINITY_DN95868_c0_g1_i1.p1  ORF type:complete len:216 (+),score=14.97 TRINITY_DN95868_c0_g1_i1:145-792(+)
MDPDMVTTIRPPPTAYSVSSSHGSRRSEGGRSYSSSRRPTAGVGSEMLRSSSVPQIPIGTRRPSQPSQQGMLQPAYSMQLGNLPYVNIPGYTGFIPGKASESILGSSHSRTNALALMACSRRGEPEEQDHFARRTNAYGLMCKRRGPEIPGYTGYIPAKNAANVFGTTFNDSNATAMEVCREMALNRSHRPPMGNKHAPLCWTGNHSAYVAGSQT